MMYSEMYTITEAANDGLPYKEALEMTLDELELFIYLKNASQYRSNDTIEAERKK